MPFGKDIDIVLNLEDLDNATTYIVVAICPECEKSHRVLKRKAKEILEKECCEWCAEEKFLPDPVIKVRRENRTESIKSKIAGEVKRVQTTKKKSKKKNPLPASKFTRKKARKLKKSKKSKFEIDTDKSKKPKWKL